MPPRSPLPQHNGLDAAWVRTPDRVPGAEPPWATMGEFLAARFPAHVPVARMLAEGAFVDARGRPWTGGEAYRPNAYAWFHRQLVPEPAVPFEVEVLHADQRIVVVDKPHFLATTPRGTHVTETVLVRLRTSLGLPELAPAHRLDRLTAGVLLLTVRPQDRAAHAGVFQAREATKTYEALAPFDPALTFPRRLVGRIEKRRGRLQAELVDGEPNAETLIELVEVRGQHARYRLTPLTGKTHQLRVQLAALGLPILGDPLYPSITEVDAGDFSAPLQLVARSIAFPDPVDGGPRTFTSRFALDWPADAQ